MGPFGYRAIEALLGYGGFIEKIDLWATACTLVEMMTREPLFQGTTLVDVTRSVLSVLGVPDQEAKLESFPLWSEGFGGVIPFEESWSSVAATMGKEGADFVAKMLKHVGHSGQGGDLGVPR